MVGSTHQHAGASPGSPTVRRPAVRRHTLRLGLVATLLPSLAACGATAKEAGRVVTVEDAWIKAAEGGMTGAFGTLVNGGDDDVTVVSATSPAAERVELHETAAGASGEMVMREKDGGFTVPAGAELVLEPGGDHLMLMGLQGPVPAGGTVAPSSRSPTAPRWTCPPPRRTMPARTRRTRAARRPRARATAADAPGWYGRRGARRGLLARDRGAGPRRQPA